jgi:hypothetical protein
MGRLRTSQELDEYFALQRAKRKRKEEALQRAKIKRKEEALQCKKNKELDNTKEQEEKAARRLEKRFYEAQRTIIIYHTRYVSKGFDDSELYNTREQLKEAEERYEGRINWNLWDKLTAETKQQFK